MRSLRKTFEANILILLAIATAASPLRAQNKPTPYPEMAPADQYRMSRDAEIMLARSAAPPSISQDAEVLVLGQRSYETAAKGKNGFVCMVQRSWTASFDDPEFCSNLPQLGSGALLPPHQSQENQVGFEWVCEIANRCRH